MPQVKTAYRNILEGATLTLSGTTEDSSFPLARLSDRNIGRMFKPATAAAMTLKIDQGASPVAVDRLIIPAGHNLHALDGTHYHPTYFFQNYGTVVSGSISELSYINGTYHVLADAATTPGLRAEYRFQNIPAQVSSFHLKGRYEGSGDIYWEIYNYYTTLWERLTAEVSDLPDSTVDRNLDAAIPSPIGNYHGGSAGNYTVKFCLNHSGAGTITDRLYIDYAAVGAANELVLEYSDDDATYTQAASLTPVSSELIDLPFASGTHRYWKFRLTSPAVIPEIMELFVTSTYSWARGPQRGGSKAFDPIFNVKVETTPAGHDRFIVQGSKKRPRLYTLRITEAQRVELDALNEAWAGAKPFWLYDHEGVWIFVKLASRMEKREVAHQAYDTRFDALEVVP